MSAWRTCCDSRAPAAHTSMCPADAYRIEADCAMRDYDALEVDAGIMREALAKISRTVGIVTRTSYEATLRTAPEYTAQGAHDLAVAALQGLRVQT